MLRKEGRGEGQVGLMGGRHVDDDELLRKDRKKMNIFLHELDSQNEQRLRGGIKHQIILSDQRDPCIELKLSREGARACQQQSIESARSGQLKNRCWGVKRD
jgi:hypothetical protein